VNLLNSRRTEQVTKPSIANRVADCIGSSPHRRPKGSNGLIVGDPPYVDKRDIVEPDATNLVRKHST
jgi:hypothetical protein